MRGRHGIIPVKLQPCVLQHRGNDQHGLTSSSSSLLLFLPIDHSQAPLPAVTNKMALFLNKKCTWAKAGLECWWGGS